MDAKQSQGGHLNRWPFYLFLKHIKVPVGIQGVFSTNPLQRNDGG